MEYHLQNPRKDETPHEGYLIITPQNSLEYALLVENQQRIKELLRVPTWMNEILGIFRLKSGMIRSDDIAERLGITAQAACNRLTKLHKMGLLEREYLPKGIEGQRNGHSYAYSLAEGVE